VGALYGDEATGATTASVEASLGCGVPTAVADLREGETVLEDIPLPDASVDVSSTSRPTSRGCWARRRAC
jgi:hypothetical protein